MGGTLVKVVAAGEYGRPSPVGEKKMILFEPVFLAGKAKSDARARASPRGTAPAPQPLSLASLLAFFFRFSVGEEGKRRAQSTATARDPGANRYAAPLG